MSVNEGNLDAVQSYDSELLTFGVMQKTVNPEGYGELPIQLWEFKEEYPNDFKELLENCGWSIKKEGSKFRAYYKNETGIDLKNRIRMGFKKEKYGKKVASIPLEPFIALGKSEIYQSKQIDDFISRLRACLEEKVVKKYHKDKSTRIKDEEYTFKIKDVFLSKLGRANGIRVRGALLSKEYACLSNALPVSELAIIDSDPPPLGGGEVTVTRYWNPSR